MVKMAIIQVLLTAWLFFLVHLCACSLLLLCLALLSLTFTHCLLVTHFRSLPPGCSFLRSLSLLLTAYLCACSLLLTYSGSHSVHLCACCSLSLTLPGSHSLSVAHCLAVLSRSYNLLELITSQILCRNQPLCRPVALWRPHSDQQVPSKNLHVTGLLLASCFLLLASCLLIFWFACCACLLIFLACCSALALALALVMLARLLNLS